LHRAFNHVVLTEIIDAQPVGQQFVDGKGTEHDEYLDGECPYDVSTHA
jgi:hypothetical protein